MSRTTQNLVVALLLDQYEEPDDLTPYIESAEELVTECCGEVGYTNARLEKIERWLSAHFYKVVKRQELREEIGTVRVAYEGKVDLRLQVTEFGQQALVLDTKGGLAALNNTLGSVRRSRIGVDYLGSEPE